MYSLLVWICVFSLTFTETQATGQFTIPGGSDGSNTFRIGDTMNIAWTGVAQYPTFSLGILSTTNATVSWFISNSQTHPTTYQWKVDVQSLGFDISSSRLFKLYACNGSYFEGSAFTLGFESVLFNIGDAATTTSSSSTSSTMKPSTTASATLSTTSQPSVASSVAQSSVAVSSSDPLSVGAKAGIGIAVALGSIAIISALIWLFVTRRRRNPQPKPLVAATSELAAGWPATARANPKQYEYYSPATFSKTEHGTLVYEAPSQNATRVQPSRNQRQHSGRPVELAG